MSNAIELYDRLNNPVEAIERLGTLFAKSGLAGCDRPEQGQTLAWICLCEKKSPTEIIRTYDIIGGKLRKKALAALADFRMAGGKHRWIETGDDGKAATIELTYEGQTIKSRFTIEDAQRQGLIRKDSGWTKTPGNMLRARAISNGVAMLCPEIFAGEESGEIAPTPPAAMDLAKVAPPEVKVEPPTIDVAATVDDEKTEAAMGLAPLPKMEAQPTLPTPEPKPEFKPGPAYESKGGLSDETVKQVEDAIGTAGPSAVAWMLKEGWLQKGQGLESLTEPRAKRIIRQRDSFLRAIGGAA